MRASLAGWIAAGVITVVMGAALAMTNNRIAALEAQIEQIDDNFIQLSVPLDQNVQDIAELYDEMELLRDTIAMLESDPAPTTVVMRSPTSNSVSMVEPDVDPVAYERARRQAEDVNHPEVSEVD